MYFRCSVESKPAWKGSNRVLFQNNSSQSTAKISKRIRSSPCSLDFLKLTCQKKANPTAMATRTIQNRQIFFTASNVRSPPAIEFPAPGVFAAAASAAGRHEEPANDAS